MARHGKRPGGPRALEDEPRASLSRRRGSEERTVHAVRDVGRHTNAVRFRTVAFPGDWMPGSRAYGAIPFAVCTTRVRYPRLRRTGKRRATSSACSRAADGERRACGNVWQVLTSSLSPALSQVTANGAERARRACCFAKRRAVVRITASVITAALRIDLA
jgi:hypothetical protein